LVRRAEQQRRGRVRVGQFDAIVENAG
jgi:hypothetical protein